MIQHRWCGLISIALALFSQLRASGDVRLPSVFSDHMVLQRGKPVAIWGWADDGEKVEVSLGKHRASTVASGGRWKLFLPELKAGGPHTLQVRGKNELAVRDVLVGEVWICSGQSNMEWPMTRTFEPEKAIAQSQQGKIRLLTVPKLKANQPVDDIKATWQECAPSSVSNFSAVAYYFGRDLQKALRVPIGLIHTSWGGSPAEVWMREQVLAENGLYNAEILQSFAAQLKRYEDELAKWEAEKAALEKEGKTIARGRPGLGWKPAELYNGMIAPLIPFAIRGAIWYQGESNAGRAWQYRMLFPDMIQNWRLDFEQGDFPFLFVQLAPWDRSKKRELAEITKEPAASDWAELREAQSHTTRVLPNAGMAVITDYGDKDDIHPMKKEPVGARLALAARGLVYGHKVAYSGPVYRDLTIENGRALVSFDHVHGGLRAQGGSLRGFEIAGADRKFVWAEARIEGQRVLVESPAVPQPIAVRYGWSDFPVVNLFNKAGLPASPFRTDNFPMVSGPKSPAAK